MLLNIDLAKTNALHPLDNVTDFKNLVKEKGGDWEDLYDIPNHYPCYAIFVGHFHCADEGTTTAFVFIYPK